MKYFFTVILIFTFIGFFPVGTQAQTGSFLDQFFGPKQTQETEVQDDFPLDIVWKAHTLVPGDYVGKALPINGSVITLVALTPTRNTDALEFTWVIKDSSSRTQGAELNGVGENIFSFIVEPTIIGFNHRIQVVAQNTITGEGAVELITISLQNPEIYLGLIGELGSLVRPSIQSATVSPGQTLSVIARPFYFNIETASPLLFNWLFDGKRAVGGQKTIFNLSIGTESGTGVRQTLNLNVESLDGRHTNTSATVIVQ